MQTQLERQRDIAGAILSALPDQVIAPRRIGALAHPGRLAIHARNMRASLTSVLASIFPATQRLTGEGFFAYAAAQFIAAAPPRDPIVDLYGEGLPSFLERFPPAAHLAFLPDLARLEWLLHSLSRTAPARPSPPGELPDAPDFRAVLSPAACLFSSLWPVDRIRASDDLSSIDMTEPAQLHLWAADDGVCIRRLCAAEFAFISALHQSRTLSQAVSAASIDPAFDIHAALARLLASGCITAMNPYSGDAQ